MGGWVGGGGGGGVGWVVVVVVVCVCVCVCVCVWGGGGGGGGGGGIGGGGGGDRISLTTVHSDFSSFLLLSPYKSILSITTKGGWLSSTNNWYPISANFRF